jgi:aryl-alcohol dehydrogenase-like predicted oxidoreductase
MSKPESTTTDPLKLSKVGFGCWQFSSQKKEDYWGLDFT